MSVAYQFQSKVKNSFLFLPLYLLAPFPSSFTSFLRPFFRPTARPDRQLFSILCHSELSCNCNEATSLTSPITYIRSTSPSSLYHNVSCHFISCARFIISSKDMLIGLGTHDVTAPLGPLTITQACTFWVRIPVSVCRRRWPKQLGAEYSMPVISSYISSFAVCIS